MKKADVIPIYGADWPPEQVLKYAAEKEFEGVVIVGWLKESGKFYFASSYGQDSSILYDLKCAEQILMKHMNNGV